MKELFSYILLLGLITGCTRSVERSSLKIQLPKNNPSKANKSVGALNSLSWGLNDPTETSQMDCYAVFVGGPEEDMKTQSCEKEDGTQVFESGVWSFVVEGGTAIELDVPVGLDREIFLLGFDATSPSDCLNFNPLNSQRFSVLSHPHLISTATVDLTGAEHTVTMSTSMNGATKIETCKGPNVDAFFAGVDGTTPGGPVSFIDNANIPEGFAGGTHSNTEFSSTAVKLRQTTDAEKETLTAILPGSASALQFVANFNDNHLDDSGNANHGTPLGGTGFAAAALGNGATFDGVDDKVDFGDATEFDVSGALTVMFWVISDANQANNHIISKSGSAQSYHIETQIGGSGSNLRFVVDDGGNPTTVTTTNFLNNGQLYHIAAVWDGGGNVQIFIDGVLDASNSGATGALQNITDPLVIGARSNTGGFFDGTVDNVSIWSTALTATDINQVRNFQLSTFGGGQPGLFTSRIMDAGASTDWQSFSWVPVEPYGKELVDESLGLYSLGNISTSGLLRYWKLNEPSKIDSSVIFDATINAGDGTLSTGDGATNKSVQAQLNTGIELDGVNDEIVVSAAPDVNDLAQLSISAWINPDNLGSNDQGRILDKFVSPDGWTFSMFGGDSLRFLGGFNSNNALRTTAANSIKLNTWQHVAVTWDGGLNATNIRIFINGNEAVYQTTTNGVGTRQAETNNLVIGDAVALARDFDGEIDESFTQF